MLCTLNFYSVHTMIMATENTNGTKFDWIMKRKVLLYIILLFLTPCYIIITACKLWFLFFLSINHGDHLLVLTAGNKLGFLKARVLVFFSHITLFLHLNFVEYINQTKRNSTWVCLGGTLSSHVRFSLISI